MDLLNEMVRLKTKSTLFSLLVREISQLLCYEKLLNTTYVAYKKCIFREMQFWSHCYTVVSYQALFRLSVYKIPAVYLSGAKIVFLHDMPLWFPDYQSNLKFGLLATKPVFGVSEKVRFKPVSSATETS